VKLTANALDLMPRTQTLSAGTTRVRMVLSSGATVTGHVRGLSPEAGVSVRASGAGGGGAGTVIADGSYVIRGLPPGHYALQLDALEPPLLWMSPDREVEVSEGKPTRVDFDETVGATVHLTGLGGRRVMVLPGVRTLPTKSDAFAELFQQARVGGGTGDALDIGPLPSGDYTLVLVRSLQGHTVQTSRRVISVGSADVRISAASATEGPRYPVASTGD
jgi:hypothetical protein